MTGKMFDMPEKKQNMPNQSKKEEAKKEGVLKKDARKEEETDKKTEKKPAQQESAHESKKEPKQESAHEQKHGQEHKQEQNQDPRDARIADLTDTLQRLQAEFENFKKRCDRENAQYRSFANKDLVRKLLPILDSFELALKSKKGDDHFTKGVELLYAQLFSALESEGLKKMEAKGKKFDPMQHEALLVQESGGEEDIILEELQKGYLLNGAVLRPAKVKISRAAQEKREEKKGEKK